MPAAKLTPTSWLARHHQDELAVRPQNPRELQYDPVRLGGVLQCVMADCDVGRFVRDLPHVLVDFDPPCRRLAHAALICLGAGAPTAVEGMQDAALTAAEIHHGVARTDVPLKQQRTQMPLCR